jgi:ubiquinone/menaquinone biosynthesis C-methylase UbiE
MRAVFVRFVLAVACAAVAGPAVTARQLGSRTADDWIKVLESPERTSTLGIDHIIETLHLKSGDTVADIGAGTGIFSLPLARAVAPAGKVYAVDVDPRLVEYIRTRAAVDKVANVQAVLGEFTDPKLPGQIDLGYFHDVLHHIANRPAYLAKLASYLKPGGRIAVVEMDPLKGSHRDDPTLQVSKAQLKGWMTSLGFTAQQELDLPGDRWMAVYGRK